MENPIDSNPIENVKDMQQLDEADRSFRDRGSKNHPVKTQQRFVNSKKTFSYYAPPKALPQFKSHYYAPKSKSDPWSRQKPQAKSNNGRTKYNYGGRDAPKVILKTVGVRISFLTIV